MFWWEELTMPQEPLCSGKGVWTPSTGTRGFCLVPVSHAAVALFQVLSCCVRVALVLASLSSSSSPLTSGTVFLEQSLVWGINLASLKYRWLRGCAPYWYRHYNWLFFFLNSGVHVQMTNLYARIHKNLLLNCMTVQMAELSVVCLSLAYLFVFSQQMLRYNCVFLMVSKNHST